MQEPGFPSGSWLSPTTPRKRTRQKRTVFSAQQLLVLEKFFEGKHYGTYGERETLAAMLNLQEYQVQVWLKNRRAKDRRLQRLRGQQGPGAPAAPQEPGVCATQPAQAHAPAPAPAPARGGPVIQGNPVRPASPVLPATPVFPKEPVFPAGPVLSTATLHHKGPGFCNLPPHNPWKVFPAADPSASSYSQACWDPAPGVQGTFSAAIAPAPDPDPGSDPDPAPVPALDPDPDPAPAPDPVSDPDPDPSMATVSPQGPNFGNFSPDPDFTELFSPYCPLEEPLSSPRPWYDFVGDSEVDLFQLLNLEESPSPPSPADAAAPEGTRVCANQGARSACQCVLPGICSCAKSAHL